MSFEGEDNPENPAGAIPMTINSLEGHAIVYVTAEERDVLKVLLERDFTSRPSYDGLRQLLSLSHHDAEILLRFLERI